MIDFSIMMLFFCLDIFSGWFLRKLVRENNKALNLFYTLHLFDTLRRAYSRDYAAPEIQQLWEDLEKEINRG
jgi:hypothetical protein